VGVLVVLLTAGKLSFSREWFAVGRILGNSLQMRGEIQYALAQMKWLEMEGRRCASVEELWTDLVFIGRKLGFKAARLKLEDGERIWQTGCLCNYLKNSSHMLQNGRLGVLELSACLRPVEESGAATAMPLAVCTAPGPIIANHEVFEILSEIMAEGWMKASRAWLIQRGKPNATLGFNANPAPTADNSASESAHKISLPSAPRPAHRPSV